MHQVFTQPCRPLGLVTMAHLAGMDAALCDEEGTGPLQGPVQFLESRVDRSPALLLHPVFPLPARYPCLSVLKGV